MFTRCPECETVFQIEIEELKAAEGKVCCGECDRVFNALVSLTDTPTGDLPPTQDASGDAQEDAESPERGEEVPQAGDLFEGLSAGSAGEESVDPAPWAPDEVSAEHVASPPQEQAQWEQKLAELGLIDEQGPDSEAQVADSGEEHGEHGEQAEEPGEPADWLQPREVRRHALPWALAAVLAGLALIAQALHYWREDLARTPVFEPWLAQFYQALGSPLPTHWDVHAYLVEKGAVSDHPEMAGTLLVNAIISNSAAQPMPYPLLKVTLLDRWGEAIGERFFAPGEYLQTPGNPQALITGSASVEASVLIVDPGMGAVSYGIDVCLRDADNRLSCAHQDQF